MSVLPDKPPKRRWRFLLDVHADTLEDLTEVISDGMRQLGEGKSFRSTFGSPSSGGYYELVEDFEQNPARYRELLEAFLAKHAPKGPK